MNHDEETASLAAEALAVQAILTHVLFQIGKENPALAGAIKRGFNDAATDIESLAIKLGPTARPDHVADAIHIIEQLRTASLSDQDKPRHGV